MSTYSTFSYETLDSLLLSGGGTRGPAMREQFAPLAPLSDAPDPRLAIVLGLTARVGASRRIILSVR